MSTQIRWVGIDRNGNARTGSAAADNVAEWTRLHFNARWRKLVVKADGRTVAGIEKNIDGQRTWWAEDSIGGIVMTLALSIGLVLCIAGVLTQQWFKRDSWEQPDPFTFTPEQQADYDAHTAQALRLVADLAPVVPLQRGASE